MWTDYLFFLLTVVFFCCCCLVSFPFRLHVYIQGQSQTQSAIRGEKQMIRALKQNAICHMPYILILLAERLPPGRKKYTRQRGHRERERERWGGSRKKKFCHKTHNNSLKQENYRPGARTCALKRRVRKSSTINFS